MQPGNWLKTMQIAVFGPRCALCHAPASTERDLCGDCTRDLPYPGRSCRHCALALPRDARVDRCPACVRRPVFDAGVAAFDYREPMRWLIARLKYSARLELARTLGDLLADRVTATGIAMPDALVPVPLHPAGYRRRGFNQAELLARRVARRLERPLAADAIVRIRDTARQSELAASARVANVRGAFVCPRPLTHAHVAIVDDVVTTTRTAAAVAGCLRAAGVARVDLYCVARAQ